MPGFIGDIREAHMITPDGQRVGSDLFGDIPR